MCGLAEYNLYGGYLEGWLTIQEIKEMIDHLMYCNKEWVFDDTAIARKFAQITIDLSKEIWCSAWNGFVYTQTAQLLKRGLELEIITMDDLIFGYDAQVWQVLTSCNDAVLNDIMATVINYPKASHWLTQKNMIYMRRVNLEALIL